MQQVLTLRLYGYIKEHHPDLLLSLQEKGGVTHFLYESVQRVSDLLYDLIEGNKPPYIIEETCMQALTENLGPSKYDYINQVFQEEFAGAYQVLENAGIIRYELVNLVSYCADCFEAFPLPQSGEPDRLLYSAVTGAVSEYIQEKNIGALSPSTA